jgi:ribosomal protein S3AE
MSDTAEDFGFDARQLLNKGKTHSLRKQMREFVSEHDSDADLRELRDAVASGKPLSDIVTEERDERL